VIEHFKLKLLKLKRLI